MSVLLEGAMLMIFLVGAALGVTVLVLLLRNKPQ